VISNRGWTALFFKQATGIVDQPLWMAPAFGAAFSRITLLSSLSPYGGAGWMLLLLLLRPVLQLHVCLLLKFYCNRLDGVTLSVCREVC